jgi:hypothetical protein
MHVNLELSVVTLLAEWVFIESVVGYDYYLQNYTGVGLLKAIGGLMPIIFCSS